MLHGWIILDKPIGLGSTQAVGAVKRLLREAGEPKTKVGHGGTLDPLASGVLPIALGEATKLAGRMLDATKEYEFTIKFGAETDTLDGEGAMVATSDARPTPAQIAAILPSFTGPIEQVPPAYSALKIEGKPAYARVRAGEQLAMKPRAVIIHSIEIRGDPESTDQITLSATVSKGTYIRSLARDIARAAGALGQLAMLRRTRAGPFALEAAVSLDFLEQSARERALTRAVLPLQAALDDIPALPVTPGQASLLAHGQRLAGFPEQPGLWLAMDGKRPVALVKATAGGLAVVRGFNL